MTHSDHHHFEVNKLLHDKMSKLYIFQALIMFVKSLIGIFVPIYLFKTGYSLPFIFFYLLGTSITYLLFIPITIRIINFLGFKKIIILSIPIYFLHILTLNYVSTSNDIFFHLSWFSFGVYAAFFWPAMHSEIALNGSNKHRGSQMGTLQIITTIFSTIAPFIGGYILEVEGLNQTLVHTAIIKSGARLRAVPEDQNQTKNSVW